MFNLCSIWNCLKLHKTSQPPGHANSSVKQRLITNYTILQIQLIVKAVISNFQEEPKTQKTDRMYYLTLINDSLLPVSLVKVTVSPTAIHSWYGDYFTRFS